MEYVNWWHQLPWAVMSLAALLVLSLTVSRPGERRQFLAVAAGVWTLWYTALTGIGWWLL